MTPKQRAVIEMAAKAWDALETMYAEQDAILKAGKELGSFPRDKFEAFIDALTEDAKEALRDA